MKEENNGTRSEGAETPEAREAFPEDALAENYLVTERLRKMPNIFGRGLLYLILLLVLSAVAYSLFGEIDTVIECPAVARTKPAADSSGRLETRMEIVVANKHIGLVEKGMRARYKFDAYPFMEYGALRGRLEDIAEAATEDKAGNFVFIAEGTIDAPRFIVEGKSRPVKPGMTAVCELATGRKSVFSVLIAKRR